MALPETNNEISFLELKNVWKSDRRWEPEKFENLKTWKLENIKNIKNDHWDMLNNFSFHVYAQNSLFIGDNDNEFSWKSSSSPDPLTLEFIELAPT